MPKAHLVCRVVVSGDTVEVYQYKNGIKVGTERRYEVVKKEREKNR